MTDAPSVLQRFLFPSVELCSEAELYLRAQRGAVYSSVAGEIRLPVGGTVNFDTYFNGFSVGKWRRYTSVRNVSFTVEAVGRFEAHLVLNHPYRAPRVIAAELFDLNERTEVVLPTVNLDDLGDGQLYLKVQALEGETKVFGAAVQTVDRPVRDVSLGVVITTFNRPTYVKQNVDRVARALKRVPRYANQIQLLIIDNAANLDISLPAEARVRVLPNANLGGAGGFARGLMTFRDSGEVSHVLFMDDDTAFEPEAIFRTIEFLAFASDPQLCLAGAMLLEEFPHIQWEAGALFKADAVHPWRPVGGGLDLRKSDNLLKNDEERSAGYGGWWFFAFPMALASVNPLPVFFRGDDVCFGLKHAAAHTITLNGIAVWHQHFGRKNGPISFFYEARNLPLVGVLASERYSARHFVARFVHHTGRMILTFKYDAAAAYLDGTRAFLAGPDEWMRIDHAALHEAIRARGGEQVTELPPELLAVPPYKPQRRVVPVLGGILSGLLLSGHIFPRKLNRRGAVALNIEAWSPVSALGRERLLYRYDATGEGFVAQRNRKRFFALAGEMLSLAWRAPLAFHRVKSPYRAAYRTMTSDQYWTRQFMRTATDPAPSSAE